MRVYLLYRGEYEDRSVDGVYQALTDAQAAGEAECLTHKEHDDFVWESTGKRTWGRRWPGRLVGPYGAAYGRWCAVDIEEHEVIAAKLADWRCASVKPGTDLRCMRPDGHREPHQNTTLPSVESEWRRDDG